MSNYNNYTSLLFTPLQQNLSPKPKPKVIKNRNLQALIILFMARAKYILVFKVSDITQFSFLSN